MTALFPGFLRAPWPRPADPEAASREIERWHEATADIDDPAAAAFAAKLAGSRPGRRCLAAIFGNSPFLSDAMNGEVGFAALLLHRGPDAAFAQVLDQVRTASTAVGAGAELMTELRRAKRRAAVAIALADIAGLWPLERVTGALSELAEVALSLASRHLLREAEAAGALRLADDAAPELSSGLVILGMGKLGARELNYSSDIDLIVLYDEEAITSADPDALQKHFVRLARGIARIMEEHTQDGYVFRTDFRLRPDPGSTPPAMSTSAAESYYESVGQNWERAAMIKARAVAGDPMAGARFLARLRPYIWRKHLDFAAISDIHSIKRQIAAHRGGDTVRLAHHNIKIGRGGIREIEFYAQTLQLIWGGRDPSLRMASTCGALEALAACGRADPKAVAALVPAYRFLRRVEHRLQMIDARQTHILPPEGPEFERLAVFLGYPSSAAFGHAMLEVLGTVERHYDQLFKEAPSLAGPGNLVFTGTEDDPGTLETLARLGFGEASQISSTIRGWHHGRYRAIRTARARELLTELMPAILSALGRTPQPDLAFLAFDRFLARLPAGVQLFSLFHANPGLLELLAEIMGAAPRLAEQLGARAQIFDSVLTPGFFDPPPALPALGTELARALEQARDFQDMLDIARRWTSERRFQAGVHLLRGLSDAEKTGATLADIAEAALAALQPAVEAEFARQHGRIPGASLAIVALGKLGGRELTITSDLDLVFLYDTQAGADVSDGDKPLSASHYFLRLANRFISAATALTAEGALYDIDLRLRPSGAKGPIAASIEGFETYFRDQAWTWEVMALTRARPITGTPALQRRIAAAIRAPLPRPRDPVMLAADVARMRALMAAEHKAHSPWDIKTWRGGLIDAEFLVQYLELREAASRPEILAPNTAAALAALIATGAIAPEDGRTLAAALRLWHAVQGVLRLTVEGPFEPEAAPEALRATLARAAGARNFAALDSEVRATAARVLAIFERALPNVV